MLNFSGKGNLITSKYLNIFNSSDVVDWKWDFVEDVSAAIDSKALEAQIGFDVLGIPHNDTFRVWFFTTDWRDCFDLSDYGIVEERVVRGTRAKGGGAIINEIYPDTNGWVELYNPTKKDTDLTGWSISWSGGTYNILAGTILQAGQYLVFNIGNIPSSDTVALYDDKGHKKDETTFTNIPSNMGWGRNPAKLQDWYITYPTPGGPNIIPEFREIIVPITGIIILTIFMWSKKDAKIFKRRKSW
jgi:hypothetical protein